MKFLSRTLTVYLLTWCCTVQNTVAQSSRTLSIPYLEQTVAIDGNLEDTTWKAIDAVSGFYNYAPTDLGLAKNQTSVKLFHDGEYLYVAASYSDSIERNQLASLKRDDLFSSTAGSDSFVMILDTQDQQQQAYYFAVNMGASQTDGLIERVSDSDGYTINTSWNAVWQTNTQTVGKQKQYELKIPFKALNFDPQATAFGLQFYVRDIKNNSWTILENVKRNYRLFDLRFTRNFRVDRLPTKTTSRFAVTPSFTTNYQNEVPRNESATTNKPSLDIQYNLSSSLKLDATINPDFSQIDVDQQVTNLTRFAVFFPERRSFFLENSDLFSNLGVDGVNPFYSRRVGSNTAIQYGLKLSGNLSPQTRIGLINVQTNSGTALAPQNYTALVTEQQLSKRFTSTIFLINRQETRQLSFTDEYNRVAGVNINYKSVDNKWIGLLNYGKSFSESLSNDNSFYHAGVWYNRRGLTWNVALKNLGENYLTDVGFVPRLYNYDASTDQVIREGYTELNTGADLTKYFREEEAFNSFRYLLVRNNSYWDEQGKLNQSSSYYNAALFFNDLSAAYVNLYHDYVDLKYAFDPLANGNVLPPETYSFFRGRVGYNSVRNNKLFYNGYVHHGAYYNGKRTAAFGGLSYRLMPYASLSASYEVNALDLKELGNETFHLAGFTGEVYFSNRLNWTTYVQYNTQFNNFNINSRIQWEYKPLSYLYLVVTDNHDQFISRTNWGVAFKMNYRFDF